MVGREETSLSVESGGQPLLEDSGEQQRILASVRAAAESETLWNSGFVFNTLCCRPHPLAVQAYLQFQDRNLLKEQSVEGRRMEEEAVSHYSMWFGAREQLGRNGYVCSGGTEGNFVALWAAKARLPGRNKVVLAQYAHYSYDRFALPLGLSLVSIPLNAEHQIDVDRFVAAIDQQTLAVIVTAGDPVLGRVDDLPRILAAARSFGCAVHVDAAYGGYFLPFLPEYRSVYQSALDWETGADTLTLDPHKYGLCPLGTGMVLFSRAEDLDRISLRVSFPPIESRTFQGSRSAGPSAAVWAMTHLLGRKGYEALANSIVMKRQQLETHLRTVPELEFLLPPRMSSIGFRVRNSAEATLKLFNDLSEVGYRITPQVRPSFYIRVIVHHHTQSEHITRFGEAVLQMTQSQLKEQLESGS